MKKEYKGPGKGMRPIIGYNAKNWNANFDNIQWPRNKSFNNHLSGSCPDLTITNKKTL